MIVSVSGIMSRVRPGLSSSEALRAYIVTLRKARGKTLDEMADGIKMPRRTYIEWEQGRTKDLKTPFAVRAVRFLHGWLSHLEQLDIVSEDEAKALAEEALSSGSRREEAIAVIDELLADSQKLDRLIGYGQGLIDGPDRAE